MIKRIFAIPHFHFDLEWWKTEENYAEDTIEIISSALKILKKYPEFTFVIDQFLSLKPFLEKYPQRKEEIKKYIEEGKIELVGCTLSAPDENIPTGESLVRQYLYGKRAIYENFQIKPFCAWSIDEFGHSHQMPQIIKKSGLKYCAFARGVTPWWSKFPLDFWWCAPDGSKILTHWFAAHYSGMMALSSEKINISLFEKELKARIKYEGERATTENLLIPFGTDFSIPTEQWVKFLKLWNEKENIKMEFSTPSKFFKSIEDKELPERADDLNPVLSGTYETREKVKKYCRSLQNKILSAEKFNTIKFIFKKEYPEKEFEKAWENILKNDFHDIICGTGTDKVYRNTIKRYEEAEEIVEKNLKNSLNFLKEKIDTKGKGKPIIVFNPLSFEIKDVVKIKKEIDSEFNIYDEKENIVAHQIQDEYIFFETIVPSFGYSVYFLREEKEKDSGVPFKINGCEVESKFYKILINEKYGAIESLYDKEIKKEIAKVDKFYFNEIISEEDVGNLWTVQKTGKIRRRKNKPDIKINSGPVFTEIKISGKHHQMNTSQKIILYNNLKIIDNELEIDFFGKDKRIKIIFPLNFKGNFYCETPYYVAERKNGHWCAQNFVDVSCENFGISLINSGNPGHEIEDNILSLILFRSVSILSFSLFKFIIKNFWKIFKKIKEAVKIQFSGLNLLEWVLYPYHGLMLREWASEGSPFVLKGGWTIKDHFIPYLKFYKESLAWERGKHYFKYSLYPHKNSYQEENIPKIGILRNNPPFCMYDESKSGELPKKFSFIKIEPENVFINVFKKSERDNSLILRIYEAKGIDSDYKIEFFKEIKKVEKVSLTEDEVYGILNFEKNKIKDKISKWEIITLKIEFKEEQK
jgi:alpha-mannosidase